MPPESPQTAFGPLGGKKPGRASIGLKKNRFMTIRGRGNVVQLDEWEKA